MFTCLQCLKHAWVIKTIVRDTRLTRVFFTRVCEYSKSWYRAGKRMREAEKPLVSLLWRILLIQLNYFPNAQPCGKKHFPPYWHALLWNSTLQRCGRWVSCSSAECAARAEGKGCIGTRAGTPSAKLRTVFIVTSENSLLFARQAVRKEAFSALVTKNSYTELDGRCFRTRKILTSTSAAWRGILYCIARTFLKHLITYFFKKNVIFQLN